MIAPSPDLAYSTVDEEVLFNMVIEWRGGDNHGTTLSSACG